MPRTHLTDKGPRTCHAASPETCPKKMDGQKAPHFEDADKAQVAWEQHMERLRPARKFSKRFRKVGAVVGVAAAMATLSACDGNLSVALPSHLVPGHSSTVPSNQYTDTSRKNATVTQAELDTAKSDLAQLQIRAETKHPGYTGNRTKLFGDPWTDVNHNNCDTRDDILKRDLTNRTYKTGSQCKVQTGDLVDPYTGKVIHFTRGEKTSNAVQIDHVVPLADAWNSGAWTWDAGKRLMLANDPRNLLAVDGPTNQNVKGDKTADQWTPTGYACRYVVDQITVKKLYGLSTTAAENNTMRTILANECTVVN